MNFSVLELLGSKGDFEMSITQKPLKFEKKIVPYIVSYEIWGNEKKIVDVTTDFGISLEKMALKYYELTW